MRGVACVLACVLFLVLASGCVASVPPEEPVPAPASPEPPPAGAEAHRFQDTFALLVNPDAEMVAFGGASRNCVFFWDTDGAEYEVLSGNATIRWPAGPSTPRLRITVLGAEERLQSPSGGSPLAFAFGRLEVAGDDGWGIGFWADYTVADGTLPAGQQAELALDFLYTGALPEPSVGTCAGGGP